ncbi:hypothetical protein U9M48_037403, partial [Paspalum notatum var. saurae]
RWWVPRRSPARHHHHHTPVSAPGEKRIQFARLAPLYNAAARATWQQHVSEPCPALLCSPSSPTLGSALQVRRCRSDIRAEADKHILSELSASASSRRLWDADMNQYAPDWSSTMGDACFAPLGYSGGGGGDDGLIELLWCNGHVVMQTQAPPRKPPTATRPDHKPAAGDDEAAAAAWFQYPAVDDPLERDLFAELFGETARGSEADRKEEGENKYTAPARQARLMPPPPRPEAEKDASAEDGVGVAAEECAAATEGGDSSMLTVGSSFCGSNHVQAAPCAEPPRAGGGGKAAAAARDATTVTSSSMRPRSCTTRSGGQPAGKRKQSDAAAEEEDEDAEFESAAADVTREPPQKLATAKRRRAAEVHNLSERRRRDRINEKMKALQELIPHCNKTDKASMLDEAIEYLKSLQLQLQMMWMGGGMAPPVVFQAAGVHHQYMQPMVAPPPPHHAQLASMPRMPFMAPPPAVQAPSPVPDPYARYLAVDHLPPPPPMHYLHGMGFYPPQIPALLPPAAVPAATARTSPSDGILHKKHGGLSGIGSSSFLLPSPLPD